MPRVPVLGGFAGGCGLIRAIWWKPGLKAHDKKTIWIFTNDDDPNAGNANARSQAVQKARDLTEEDHAIDLWCLNNGATKFDPHKCVNRIEPARAMIGSGRAMIDGSALH